MHIYKIILDNNKEIICESPLGWSRMLDYIRASKWIINETWIIQTSKVIMVEELKDVEKRAKTLLDNKEIKPIDKIEGMSVATYC